MKAAAFAALAALVALPARADGLDDAFKLFNGLKTPGCAIGIARKGEPAMFRAFGQADLEHAAPITPDTIFEAGSVSKQFTAAAILTLVQDGKLKLDDDIRKYLPEMPAYGQTITIDRMLTHTAGLRDWGEVAALSGWPRGTKTYTNLEALEIAARQKALNFPVGSDWSYTNTGYNLAAVIVARVSGQSFADFTRDRLFKPLGLEHTSWRDDYRRVVVGRAIAYEPGAAGWEQDMPFEFVHGNGGLLTTVGDLLVWNDALTAGKLGPYITGKLQEQAVLTNGKSVEYARGLFVDAWRGQKEISHSGATAGYRAWLGRYPDLGLSTAVLCNAGNADAGMLAHKAVEAITPAGAFAPAPDRKPPAQAAAEAELKARPGLYIIKSGFGVSRVVADGHSLRLQGGPWFEPDAAGGYKAGESRIAFKPNGDLERRMPNGVVSLYEHVAPADTSPAALAQVAGTYVSDEADAKLVVSVKDGKLVATQVGRVSAPVSLSPMFKDGFTRPGGLIRVVRGKGGKVEGLTYSGGRVWNISFKKVG